MNESIKINDINIIEILENTEVMNNYEKYNLKL